MIRALRLSSLILSLLALQAGDLAHARSASDPRPLNVNVDVGRPGRAIPPSFLGFSIEYPDLPDYTGTAQAPNRVFTRLLQQLGAYGNGPPSLRIGGNSGDQSWWNPGGAPRPPGVFNDIGPDWVAGLAGTVAEARTPVLLGLNLGLNDPSNATALLDAVTSTLPPGSVDGVEIGNEPDLYTRPKTFWVGRKMLQRPRHRATYSYDQYAAEMESYVAALAEKGVSLTAGGFASAAWDVYTAALLNRFSRRLSGVGVHAYPLRTCGRVRRRPPRILISKLLSNRQAVSRVRRLVGVASASGAGARVTEANSSVCGGVKGVSDTFATALWATNALFGYFAAGAGGVNMHTWTGAFYAPLQFRFEQGRFVGVVHPVYYGMLLFARATAFGAQLVPVTPGRATGARVWATRTPTGMLRVVVVNGSARMNRRVRVTLPGLTAPGSVERLKAPALDSKIGVSLAGKGFGSTTLDGNLLGRHAEATVTPEGEHLRLRRATRERGAVDGALAGRSRQGAKSPCLCGKIRPPTTREGAREWTGTLELRCAGGERCSPHAAC